MRDMRRDTPSLPSFTACALAVFVAMAFPSRARADDAAEKLGCVRAAEAGQKLRVQGKLVEARGELAVCARDACPAVVREDCRHWLVDIDGTVPSVVVFAKDGRGRDLEGVRVRIDGAVVAERADGRPLLVNPGEHTFEYEAPDGEKSREKIIVRAGDRNRPLTVTFGPPDARPVPTPLEKPATPLAVIPVEPEQRQINPLAWVLYGVSGLAVGGFVYLAATGSSDASDLRARCNNRCSPDEVNDVRTRLRIGDASLGVGIIAAGFATWLVLTPARVGGGVVSIGALPGGGNVGWGRTF